MTKRSLTPDGIVDAAMALADAEGLEALSMRKVAGALGVTAMSLYNHVADKEALLDRMLERVVSRIEVGETGAPWRQMLARRAASLRAALLRHPWAPSLILTRVVLGPAVLREAEATLACLHAAGFDTAQADWARNAVESHVYGYVIQEISLPVAPEAYRETAGHYAPQIDASAYPHFHRAALDVAEGRYDGRTEFEFGLTLVLDGLERWMADGGAR
ncbi:MAG: TetR/AcrR family transcriptional regulator [Paracoccaceae bacterium]